MTCNESDWNVDAKWWGLKGELYLTSQQVEDITTLSEIGSASGYAAYKTLVTKGIIAAVASPWGAIIGAALVANLGMMRLADRGCGIIVHLYQPYAELALPTPNLPKWRFESQ